MVLDQFDFFSTDPVPLQKTKADPDYGKALFSAYPLPIGSHYRKQRPIQPPYNFLLGKYSPV